MSVVKDVKKLEAYTLLVEMLNDSATIESSLVMPQKVKQNYYLTLQFHSKIIHSSKI